MFDTDDSEFGTTIKCENCNKTVELNQHGNCPNCGHSPSSELGML